MGSGASAQYHYPFVWNSGQTEESSQGESPPPVYVSQSNQVNKEPLQKKEGGGGRLPGSKADRSSLGSGNVPQKRIQATTAAGASSNRGRLPSVQTDIRLTSGRAKNDLSTAPRRSRVWEESMMNISTACGSQNDIMSRSWGETRDGSRGKNESRRKSVSESKDMDGRVYDREGRRTSHVFSWQQKLQSQPQQWNFSNEIQGFDAAKFKKVNQDRPGQLQNTPEMHSKWQTFEEIPEMTRPQYDADERQILASIERDYQREIFR